MATLESLRGSDGTLPAYAWPGGYPIIYVCSDGGVLCADCVNGKNGAEPVFDDPTDHSGWLVVGSDIHWEGPPELCAHCNAEIESAYGDPDAEGE